MLNKAAMRDVLGEEKKRLESLENPSKRAQARLAEVTTEFEKLDAAVRAFQVTEAEKALKVLRKELERVKEESDFSEQAIAMEKAYGQAIALFENTVKGPDMNLDVSADPELIKLYGKYAGDLKTTLRDLQRTNDAFELPDFEKEAVKIKHFAQDTMEAFKDFKETKQWDLIKEKVEQVSAAMQRNLDLTRKRAELVGRQQTKELEMRAMMATASDKEREYFQQVIKPIEDRTRALRAQGHEEKYIKEQTDSMKASLESLLETARGNKLKDVFEGLDRQQLSRSAQGLDPAAKLEFENVQLPLIEASKLIRSLTSDTQQYQQVMKQLGIEYTRAFEQLKDQNAQNAMKSLQAEMDEMALSTEKMAGGIKSFRDFQEIEMPIARARAQLELAGVAGKELEKQLSEYTARRREYSEMVELFRRQEEIARSLSQGFTDMIIKGKSFADVLKNVVALMSRMVLTKMFEGASGGIAKGLSSLIGFKRGGSMKVRGGGSPDSRLASFKVSPGESIDVRTPGQQESIDNALKRITSMVAGGAQGGGGANISITNNNDFSGADESSIERILSYVNTKDAQTVNQVQDMLSRRRMGYGRRRGRV